MSTENKYPKVRPNVPKSYFDHWLSITDLSLDSKFAAFNKKALVHYFKFRGYPLPKNLIEE